MLFSMAIVARRLLIASPLAPVGCDCCTVFSICRHFHLSRWLPLLLQSPKWRQFLWPLHENDLLKVMHRAKSKPGRGAFALGSEPRGSGILSEKSWTRLQVKRIQPRLWCLWHKETQLAILTCAQAMRWPWQCPMQWTPGRTMAISQVRAAPNAVQLLPPSLTQRVDFLCRRRMSSWH